MASQPYEAPEPGRDAAATQAPSATDCSEALLRVYEFLDGEMTPDDCEKVQSHLDTCDECLRQYHLDRAIKARVKSSCGAVEAPAALRATILQRLTYVRVEYDIDTRR